MSFKDKELGPDNKEAGDLMVALHHAVDSDRLKYYEDENGDLDSVSGVGKDIFGKYAYTETAHKGKTYLVQVREKDQIEVFEKIEIERKV